MNFIDRLNRSCRENLKEELSKEKTGVPLFIDPQVVEKAKSTPSEAQRLAKALNESINEAEE